MTSASTPIEIRNLSYSIGSRRILSEVSLTLNPGRTLGLLGLNGAGKTTLIQMILGLSTPKKGESLVFGVPSGKRKCFSKIGYAPEEPSFPDFLTVNEYLSFVADVRMENRTEKKTAIEFQLSEFELEGKKRIRDLSKGMRRKLSLAQAYIGKPELMILDEPLNGLDPLAIVKLREIILRSKREGISFLVSSHILSEVEKICDEVAILKTGELKLSATLDSLTSQSKSVESAFTEIHRGQEILA